MNLSESVRIYFEIAGNMDELTRFSNAATLGWMTWFPVVLVPFGINEEVVTRSEAYSYISDQG